MVSLKDLSINCEEIVPKITNFIKKNNANAKLDGAIVSVSGGIEFETNERTVDSKRGLWGIWELSLDPTDMAVTVTPVRNLEKHFNITDMVMPPSCNDCLKC